MYGQTEVAARISILRADEYPEHPDSVGRVLAGSRVTFAEDGQLLYHGPGAMLGYCDHRADLAAPDQMRGTVRTGDLGYAQDGFLYLTGRLSRFVKPLGRRISLDAVEDFFAELAPAAVVGDAAERAHVFVAARLGKEFETARRALLDRFALPPDTVELHYGVDLPRLPNGKTDYRRLTTLIENPTAGASE
jgi:long-subunit acyl-CoA synthetase (AMP-forming)